MIRLFRYSTGFLAVVLFASCTRHENSVVVEAQQQFMAVEMIEEPVSLASATRNFSDGMQVTVVGRIYGGSFDPFDPYEASFTIYELPEPGHNHDDPNDCPFCKRKVDSSASAIIQVCDKSGKVIKMSAEKLLNLKKNQDIAVTGTCTMVGELLIVQATKLCVMDLGRATELSAKFLAEIGTGPQHFDEGSTIAR